MTVLLFHVLELIRAMLFVWWDTASIHREEPFIFSPYILRLCPGWGTKSLMHFSVWPGQIIYVPNSLIVMMPFPVSTITENISGRRHWNCYNNCIRIIMTTFPGTAWSFELWSCPKAQIKNPWSGEHHCFTEWLAEERWIHCNPTGQISIDSRKRYHLSVLEGGGEARS